MAISHRELVESLQADHLLNQLQRDIDGRGPYNCCRYVVLWRPDRPYPDRAQHERGHRHDQVEGFPDA